MLSKHLRITTIQHFFTHQLINAIKFPLYFDIIIKILSIATNVIHKIVAILHWEVLFLNPCTLCLCRLSQRWTPLHLLYFCQFTSFIVIMYHYIVSTFYNVNTHFASIVPTFWKRSDHRKNVSMSIVYPRRIYFWNGIINLGCSLAPSAAARIWGAASAYIYITSFIHSCILLRVKLRFWFFCANILQRNIVHDWKRKIYKTPRFSD